MARLIPTPAVLAKARLAGLLYLVIIVAGLGAELGLRMPLIDLQDPQGTASAILSAPIRFRLSIVADVVMASCDIGLALLLFVLFRPIAPDLALAAMLFRLMQAVLIAANLLHLQLAGLLLANGTGVPVEQAQSLAVEFIRLHGYGYDLGLFFFGINSMLTALLIVRSGILGRVFGLGLIGAGVVYLIGSGLRFLAPDWFEAFTPFYVIPIVAETAFCLRLLLLRGPLVSRDPA